MTWRQWSAVFYFGLVLTWLAVFTNPALGLLGVPIMLAGAWGTRPWKR